MPPKGSKKSTNQAPWWWGPAVCELWAAEGKDKRREKFYAEAVEALDAVYGGTHLAGTGSRTNWGCAGECFAVLRGLISGATAHLFNVILTVRNWTVKQARDEAIQGGLCLNQEQTILEYMAKHLLHLRNQNRSPLLVVEEVREQQPLIIEIVRAPRAADSRVCVQQQLEVPEVLTQSMELLEQVHDLHQRSLAMAEPSKARVMLSMGAALSDGIRRSSAQLTVLLWQARSLLQSYR